jgi:lipopolysaccharide biosynthesis regulator YciM
MPDEAAPAVPGGRRRASRRQRRLRQDSAALAYGAVRWLVVAAVIVSVLAVGSAHVPVALAVTLSAVLAGLLAAIVDGGRLRLPPPAVILIALSAYTALQALPMPRALVGFLTPQNADVWQRTLERVAESQPTWISISLDPGASWVEAAKWLSYGAAFYAAAIIGARQGARFGAGVAFVSALVTAAVTVAHGLLGATKLYGFYEPSFAPARWSISPLLNSNSLASYLNFGALCGLGILVSQASNLHRWMTALGVATLFAISVLCSSRGAILTLPFGVLVFAILLYSRTRGPSPVMPPVSARRLLIATLLGSMALVFLGATGGTWAELLDRSYEKLRILQWSKPMIADHFWFGVGRGAFEGAFHAYGDPERNMTFTYAENLPAQWFSDWGVPVGSLALIALGWTLRPRRIGAGETPIPSAIFAAACALLAQNLFDLGLELPSIALLAVTALGAAYGERATRSRRSTPEATRSRFPPAYRALALTLAALATFVPALAWGLAPAVAERDRLQGWHAELDMKDAAATEALRTALKRAMLRHPADPYFPRLMALLAWRTRDPTVMKWIALALERDVNSGRTHYLLANVLHGKGAKNQALLELKLAVQNEPALKVEAANLALQWSRSDEDFLHAAPSGKDGAAMLFTMASLLKRDRIELRTRLLSEAVARNPQHGEARLMAAMDLLRELSAASKSKLCTGAQRADCIRTIESHIDSLRAINRENSTADELRARLLVAQGQEASAERLLNESCPRYDEAISCLRTLVEVTAELDDATRLDTAAKQLMTKACPPTSVCVRTGVWLGDFFARRGDWHGALTFYRRAAQEEPTETTLTRLADAASKAGRHAEAIDVLQRLSRIRGTDAELRTRIEHERTHALRQMLRHK